MSKAKTAGMSVRDRDLMIWLVRSTCGTSYAELGSVFGITKQRVFCIFHKVKRQMERRRGQR